MRPKSRLFLGFLLLAGLCILGFSLSLALGSVSIPFEKVLQGLFGEEKIRSSWDLILTQYRLPKAITAFLAGAALSISGLLMQTYFRNPLAGPFVLGISSGATLGVAAVIMLLDPLGIPWFSEGLGRNAGSLIAACLGSGLVMGMILMLARKVRGPTTLLLVGLMFGYASGGLVNLLVYLSESRQIQSFLIWSFGSFSRVPWEIMPLFYIPILVALLASLLASKPLNAIQLGENYARSLGVSVDRLRLWILLCSSLLAGVVTAFCGPVAFVGIAVPHLCRGIFRTPDHRILIPACIFMGGALCLFADLGSQLPGLEVTLPLNSITSLIGAPIVVWVLLRSNQRKGSFQS
jgi:iron complex transport system permease protein